MTFVVTDIQYAKFPDPISFDQSLATVGLESDYVLYLLRDFRCDELPRQGMGYQVTLAEHLEAHLAANLDGDGLRASRTRKELQYSPRLKQHADLVLVPDGSPSRVYIEIEFRPNYEKDLVKFQMAANNGRLLAAILVVAIDRKSINPNYTTMPQYASVVEIVREYSPTFPLMVVGIDGERSV